MARPRGNPHRPVDWPGAHRRRRSDLLRLAAPPGPAAHDAGRLRGVAAGRLLLAKVALASVKFHYGRKLRSDALTADAWNDTMDTVSAVAALIAVGLTLSDPLHFFNADRYGGFVVGLIVISVGVRVARETALQLMDTMPNEELMNQDPDGGVHGRRRARRGEMLGAQDRPALSRGSAPGGGPRNHRAAIGTKIAITCVSGSGATGLGSRVLVHVEPAP